MRAPPPPRKSKSRYVTSCCLRLRQLCTGYEFKKRWHLHKLHKVRRKGEILVSPLSGVHVEDMINLPTGLQNKSFKTKPLLIAAFSRGCAQSPQLRLLQRNKLYGLPLTRRKYKLKNFEATLTEKRKISQGTYRATHPCASRVGSIKKVTSKDADLRVIFHNPNVIKSTNLNTNAEGVLHSPQVLEFTCQQSIRIRDYPSLAKRPLQLEEICEGEGGRRSGNFLRSLKELKLVASDPSQGALSDAPYLDGDLSAVSQKEKIFQLKSFIKISKFSNSTTLVSYSKLVKIYASQAN